MNSKVSPEWMRRRRTFIEWYVCCYQWSGWIRTNRLQGEVWIRPISPHTISFERLSLHSHGLLSIFRGTLTQSEGCEQFSFFRFHALQHFELNGKTVTVPARDKSYLHHPDMLISEALRSIRC